MKLFICSDIMPGGVLPYQDAFIDTNLLEHMGTYDLRVGTLECAIGTDLPYHQTKMDGSMNIVYAQDEDFPRVLTMGLDVVSLANNHVFDLGSEGLENTMKTLSRNNILYCGAGRNLQEASKPAVINRGGKQIAFLAACMHGNKYLGHIELAGENSPGVNPLDIEKICLDIQDAKKRYDYVFVLPHWGREHCHYPMMECISMAKKMIRSGADGVFGSHAHVPQPTICYKGKYICFGLGNFLFPDFLLQPPRPIWYPENREEIQLVEVRLGYPDSVEKPTKATWGNAERIGQYLMVELGNQIGLKKNFVEMSRDNVLGYYWDSQRISTKLYFLGLMCKFPILRKLYCYLLKIRGANVDLY